MMEDHSFLIYLLPLVLVGPDIYRPADNCSPSRLTTEAIVIRSVINDWSGLRPARRHSRANKAKTRVSRRWTTHTQTLESRFTFSTSLTVTSCFFAICSTDNVASSKSAKTSATFPFIPASSPRSILSTSTLNFLNSL